MAVPSDSNLYVVVFPSVKIKPASLHNIYNFTNYLSLTNFKKMKKLLLLLTISAAVFNASGQGQGPRPSPAGAVSADIGMTAVKIDYFRPKMKGRKVFGEGKDFLVPYGSIWRTGANGGTKISFSTDVTVQGVKVPAGEYLIFTWPGAKEWTITLYKDLTIGGNTGAYKKENEVASFKAPSEKISEKIDTFTMNISDLSEDSTTGNVQIEWENTSVKFKVEVPKTW